jgi:membrane-associated phospholipid phosphatase
MRPEKAISIVLHPLLVLPVSALLAMFFSGLSFPDSFYWLSIWIAMSLVPTVAVTWRIGEPGLEVPGREERLTPFVTAFTSLIFSLLVFKWVSVPESVLKLGITGAVTLAAFGIGNFFDKVSVHTGAISAVAVIFADFSLPAGILLFMASVTVAWGRVKLGRHTRVQVLQGGFLGILCGAVYVLL